VRLFDGIGGVTLWMVRGAIHGAGLPMSTRIDARLAATSAGQLAFWRFGGKRRRHDGT